MLGVGVFGDNEVSCKREEHTKVKKRQKERVVIDLSPEALELIKELQARTGAGTRAELFRNMLRYAAATVDEIDAGYIPHWMDKDGNIYRSMMHKILMIK